MPLGHAVSRPELDAAAMVLMVATFGAGVALGVLIGMAM